MTFLTRVAMRGVARAQAARPSIQVSAKASLPSRAAAPASRLLRVPARRAFAAAAAPPSAPESISVEDLDKMSADDRLRTIIELIRLQPEQEEVVVDAGTVPTITTNAVLLNVTKADRAHAQHLLDLSVHEKVDQQLADQLRAAREVFDDEVNEHLEELREAASRWQETFDGHLAQLKAQGLSAQAATAKATELSGVKTPAAIDFLKKVFESAVPKPIAMSYSFLEKVASSDSGAVANVRSIIDAFLAMHDAFRGRVRCRITSATPLSSQALEVTEEIILQAGLVNAVSLQVENTVDPAMPAGVLIEVGEHLLDLTIGKMTNDLRDPSYYPDEDFVNPSFVDGMPITEQFKRDLRIHGRLHSAGTPKTTAQQTLAELDAINKEQRDFILSVDTTKLTDATKKSLKAKLDSFDARRRALNQYHVRTGGLEAEIRASGVTDEAKLQRAREVEANDSYVVPFPSSGCSDIKTLMERVRSADESIYTEKYLSDIIPNMLGNWKAIYPTINETLAHRLVFGHVVSASQIPQEVARIKAQPDQTAYSLLVSAAKGFILPLRTEAARLLTLEKVITNYAHQQLGGKLAQH